MTDQQLTVRDKFVNQLMGENQASAIKNALPSNLDFDAFTDVVIRAVQENPKLLEVDNKMSLFLACQRAAQDGLLPDKREGALIVYSINTMGTWQSAVQWMPMIGGLRKRLAKLDDPFDIRARVVYQGDHFEEELGDEERIVHKPTPLEGQRGAIIGAYAIATRRSDGERWRETMNKEDLEQVKGCSKSGDRGPWGNWYGEMARKSVVKRLIKSLPIDDSQLQDIISRDNEDYDPSFRTEPQASETAKNIQAEARAPEEPKKLAKKTTRKKATTKKAVAKKPEEKKVAPKASPKPKNDPIEGNVEPVPESENPTPPEVDPDQPEIFQGIDPGF